MAYTDLIVSESTPVQFLGSGTGQWRVWLNGRPIFHRAQAAPFRSDADRFDGTLDEGRNRLVVQVATTGNNAAFQLRFRRKNSTAELEALVQAALSRTGNADRGRKLFFDTVKTQCSKCHHIQDQGERIGPELTGIGGRFSRIHIVESILEPSRTVTPGYQTVAVALRSGLVVTGIRIAETEKTLTLADNQGQKHILATAEIDEQTTQPQSIMPDGLAKPLTMDEFVDLIEFLVAQKERRGDK